MNIKILVRAVCFGGTKPLDFFSDCLADSEEEVRRKAGLHKVEEKIDV